MPLVNVDPHRVGWVVLAAVEFGGCAIWAFHFVAMIALDIGIPVDFNPLMTIFSAIVAIIGMLGGLTSNIWIKKRKGRDMYLPISNNNSVSEHGATINGILRLNGIDSAQTPVDTPEHESSTSDIGTALNLTTTPFSWGIDDDGAPLPVRIVHHLQRGLNLRVFVVGVLMSLSICAMYYIALEKLKSITAAPNQLVQSLASEIPPEIQETSNIILLVEDNLINQQLGVKMLKKLGRTVDVVENSKMPVLSGPSTYWWIRGMEAAGELLGRLRIISLTANVDLLSWKECMEAGSDHFLPKPLTLKMLRGELEKAF
ncbi:hypothetical protein Dda_9476 [Drechslerella dactyloides]|uniref:Response regulatory domain-containing protein n=1 Tax=Drechslerella dactyloides TaxID=74499 RepID=A0AAD6IQR3_DREDA|nr:hypothetical protein Dda_9476 [Drechslerella dactyloides]